MTIVIGDLHGKKDILYELLENKDEEIVCIGDYVDSFEENISEQIEMLETILWCTENRKGFQALWGNHENSYMHRKYLASGWKPSMQMYINGIKDKMKDCLDLYTVVGDYLITHAGVSRGWLPPELNSIHEITNYLDLCDWDEISVVGRFRGGWKHDEGGPLWCDYWNEFNPIEGIKQIVGHSAWRPVREKPGIVVDNCGNWNIDCLDREREILEITENFVAIRKF